MRTILLFAILMPLIGVSQDHTHMETREITFPDVPGYKTLVTDLHIHRVFSDGSVWPSIRIEEGHKDGVDVISMTEHLEYQPHEDDIPHPDRNRSHEIAANAAEGSDMLVIKGSEITRSMPPGHSNAIFIQDANKLLLDDAEEVFEEAHNQGAFVFWNHPNYIAQKKDGVAELTRLHKKLIERGHLNGIEVVNEHTFSKEALQIALDNNLTIIGTSDVHGLVDWDFNVAEGGHRPVTLVFAKERTAESVKEALFAGKTAIWFNNLLVGKNENLTPLIETSLQVEYAQYIGDSKVLRLAIVNYSDVDYMLLNKSEYSFHAHDNLVMIEAQSKTFLDVKTIRKKKEIDLDFQVMNAVVAPDQYANLHFDIKVEKEE